VTDSSHKIRAPRERSSAAYALLFARSELRAPLAALLAFRAEIDDTLFSMEDPGVAALKRAWWGDEIRRLSAGEPRHPISVALCPAGPALVECLENCLVAANAWPELGEAGMDFPAFCVATGGSLAAATGILGTGCAERAEPPARRAATDLGAAIRATALVRLSRVAPAVRKVLMGDPQFTGSEEAVLDWALDRHDRGIAGMPAPEQENYRPLLVLASLYRRLLKRLRDSSREDYVEVGTPAKLWTAWSAATATRRRPSVNRRSDSHAS
jgi:phytoene synthase